MRVVRTALVVTGITLALLGVIIVISYGYHRMTNPSFSPRRGPTTTRGIQVVSKKTVLAFVPDVLPVALLRDANELVPFVSRQLR